MEGEVINTMRYEYNWYNQCDMKVLVANLFSAAQIQLLEAVENVVWIMQLRGRATGASVVSMLHPTQD